MDEIERLFKDINIQIKFIPRAFILTVIILFAYLFLVDDKREKWIKIKAAAKNVWLMLFAFSLSFILMSTIFGRWPENPYKHIFDNFGFVRNGEVNMEFLENAFLFVPYSFFFLQAHHHKKAWKSALILSGATSCCIEVLQLIFWSGSFQFSDIAHNIEGGMIGCGLWYVVKTIKEKKPLRTTWRCLVKKVLQRKG